jgi:prophage antirepressor-like protein
MKIVGQLKFDNKFLDVYESLEEPIFRAGDIASMIEYSEGNTYRMLEMCEADEKLKLPLVVAGQVRSISFVTERGLYNILEQSRKPIARKWRRIINDELIELRKSRDNNIVEQFDYWNDILDTLFIDEETGILMQSVTVQDGDDIQVPFEG